MTQTDLNRAIAQQTGESPRRIRQMGFGLLLPVVPRRSRTVRPACTPTTNDTHQTSNHAAPAA